MGKRPALPECAVSPRSVANSSSQARFHDTGWMEGNFKRRIHLFIHVPLSWQIVALFVIAIPIACVAWTITHEEVFREPRDYCIRQSETSRNLVRRKFFYLFTCEYCFSHYVTIIFLIITRYKLLYADWRGYLIGGFALVWVANQYMSLFGRLRLDIKRERVEIKEVEQQVEQPKPEPRKMPRAM